MSEPLTPEQRAKLRALQDKADKIGKKLAIEYALLLFIMIVVGTVVDTLFVNSTDFNIFIGGLSVFFAALNLRSKLLSEEKNLKAEYKKIVDGQ